MRTESWSWSRNPNLDVDVSELEIGAALARFLDKANFGGDGKQAQVTLRLHQSEGELTWLLRRWPAGRLYGPYEYAYKDGGVRRFYQLMYRGGDLRDGLIPFLERAEWAEWAPESYARYQQMRTRYRV